MSDIEFFSHLLVESGLSAQMRESHQSDWDSVINSCSEVPTHYLGHLASYQSQVFRHIDSQTLEISMVLYNDHKPCAVWPLYVDMGATNFPVKSINDQFGGIVVPPLFTQGLPKKTERRLIKASIAFIQKLVTWRSGDAWRLSELSGYTSVSQWYQCALEVGGLLERLNYELYVDLGLGLEEIRRYLRKSYKPLISSGLKTWTVNVLTDRCDKTWSEFRNLHRDVSGRVTRPAESWDIQHNAIDRGEAFLVYVKSDGGQMVGGGFFDHSRNEMTYSVATYKRELSAHPLGHIVQYTAIQEAIARGLSRYYIGTQFFRAEHGSVSDKQVDISSFKAGFATHLLARSTLIVCRS